MGRIRSHAVTVRFTESEFEEFQKKLSKSDYTQAEFILDAVREIPIQPPQRSAEIRELMEHLKDMDRQLRGMATNINQMAKVANQTQDVVNGSRLKDYLNQTKIMRKELNETWRYLRQLTHKEPRMQP